MTRRSLTLDRVAFHEGGRLAAADLQDAFDRETTQRALHVQAVHQTFGIALGLEIGLPIEDGETVTDAVEVGSGVAYDCFGRLILLSETRRLHLPPPVAGGEGEALYDLTAAHEPTLAADGCAPAGLRRQERPRFRWHPARRAETLAETVRLGEELPLGRFTLQRDDSGRWQALPAIDPRFRRYTQPLARPYIASGSASLTAPWSSSRLAWTATVDTGAAAFTGAPHYFVTLTAHPLVALERPELLQQMVGPFVSIRNPGRTSFSLEVRFLSRFTLDDALPLSLNWVGVEATGGCPPPPLYLVSYLFLQPIFVFPIFNVVIGGIV